MSFVRALNDLGALDALIDVLDKEAEVSFFRGEILKDIGKMLEQHPDRVPRIAELLGHTDAEIREAAAGVLKDLGPTAGLPYLPWRRPRRTPRMTSAARPSWPSRPSAPRNGWITRMRWPA